MVNQHVITLGDDDPFEVELNSRADTETAVVLVHGFGVKRDSRGLFTDIEQQLGDSILSVRGDFSLVTAKGTSALSLSVQAQRLNQIIAFIRTETDIKTIVYIGHSQGCLVIAKAAPINSQVILLAPPITSPAAERFAVTPGWSRPGSKLNMDGDSLLKRSDDSITVVNSAYWQDFKAFDPVSLYSNLAKHNQVNIIFAGSDNVLGQQEPITDIPFETVKNADHDFSGGVRTELVQKVLDKLRG